MNAQVKAAITQAQAVLKSHGFHPVAGLDGLVWADATAEWVIKLTETGYTLYVAETFTNEGPFEYLPDELVEHD